MDEQFFKGEYFKQLNERLEKMEQKLDIPRVQAGVERPLIISKSSR